MTRIVMKGLDLLGEEEACLLHPRMISNKHMYYRNDSFNNNNNDGDELYICIPGLHRYAAQETGEGGGGVLPRI